MDVAIYELPNALHLPIGYIHTVVTDSPNSEVYYYDSARCGHALATFFKPGNFNFILTDNKTDSGEWTFSTATKDKPDMVNHPPHYTSSKAECANCKESIECIEITRHMSFNIGNAVKYLWRHELKGGLEDLKKAKWYINDAIKQLEDK